MVSDTVGDFIIQLKNAGMVGKGHVSVPYSKLKEAIATKLQSAGYIEQVEVNTKKQFKALEITLKYAQKRHAINDVKRVSKPGRRLYKKVADIHPIKFGKGHVILSTPAGILTGEEARQQNVGGEELFLIW